MYLEMDKMQILRILNCLGVVSNSRDCFIFILFIFFLHFTKMFRVGHFDIVD